MLIPIPGDTGVALRSRPALSWKFLPRMCKFRFQHLLGCHCCCAKCLLTPSLFCLLQFVRYSDTVLRYQDTILGQVFGVSYAFLFPRRSVFGCTRLIYVCDDRACALVALAVVNGRTSVCRECYSLILFPLPTPNHVIMETDALFLPHAYPFATASI